MNFAIGRQDLFYEALEIGARANRWCQKMDKNLFKAMKSDTSKTKASMERIWYSQANGGYIGGIDHSHYNRSRYRGVNLHAFFRFYNGLERYRNEAVIINYDYLHVVYLSSDICD